MSSIAIIGAGQELAEELVGEILSRGYAAEEIRLFGGDRVAGETLNFEKLRLRIDLATPEALEEMDAALFLEDGLLARDLLPALAEQGTLVVDATPYSRRTGTGVLVVPEVNAERVQAAEESRVFAVPMPATTGLAIALAPLCALGGMVRVVATVFEPASQRGAPAVEELSRQSVAMVSGEGIDRDRFPETLAFNVRPYGAAEGAEGWAFDEQMLAEEIVLLFGDRAPEVLATIVRAPVFVGAAQSVWVELDRSVSLDEAREVLRAAPSVLLAGNAHADEGDGEASELLADPHPGPLDVAGSSAIHLARLRQDPVRGDSIGFWLAFDDLRKGLALNVAAIFEKAWRNGGANS